MDLGFGLPVSGPWATPQNMRRIATRAEELGYASLWSFQRLLHPVDDDWGPMYHAVHDPITALSYVAGLTSRIRLGVAIVNLPFYAPIVLAKALTTLDIISGGRLDAGLGLGWAQLEFTAAGVPHDQRGARGEEFVSCLKAIWTDAEVEFTGSFYEVPRSRVEPKPMQAPHPPILLGGTAEGALRRAGRIGDGWISSSRADLSRIGESISVVKAAAQEAGRSPGALRFIVRGVALVRADGADGRKPLEGTVTQIKDDLVRIEEQGVTEVFLDLNFDPLVVAPGTDPVQAMQHAEKVLSSFAPAS